MQGGGVFFGDPLPMVLRYDMPYFLTFLYMAARAMPPFECTTISVPIRAGCIW